MPNAAFESWWSAQTKRGDPSRNPRLTQDAFEAGMLAASIAKTAPEKVPQLRADLLELERLALETAAEALESTPSAVAAEDARPELTFAHFRRANVARCLKWHPAGIESWSPSDWMTAIVGELGEAASLIKMRNRERDGLPGNKFSPTQKQIADEIADVLTYLDLFAEANGVDLGSAAVSKFNEVSERVGFPDRIELATPHPAPAVAEPAGPEDQAVYDKIAAGYFRDVPAVAEPIASVKNLRHRVDPDTGSIVGHFAQDAAPSVAAEAGQMTPAQRLSELANGVRLGHCPDAGLLAKRMDAIVAAINTQPAPSAEAGQAFAWYRTVNGHRAGISFERCSPDIDGWEEHPLFTQPAPPSQGQAAMINGLDEEETRATPSVAGLTGRAQETDSDRLDWLEQQAKKSRTGVSLSYARHVEDGQVLEHGYRFMRWHFATDFKRDIRSAIDAARAAPTQPPAEGGA